jgi:type VI secretion system secreted protein Hcp
MAVDMFIQIGDIKGESKDSQHEEEIDVMAWSWGMTQSGTTHMGGGGGSGKVSVKNLSITKHIDSASTNLMLACCNGKHYETALLTVRKAGENPVEYLKITMNEVLVASVSTGGSGGEEKLTENVTLNFAKVKTEYTPQDEKGAPGATMDMGWNIATNEKF